MNWYIIIVSILIVLYFTYFYSFEGFNNECNLEMTKPFTPIYADLKLVPEQTNDGPFFDFDITHPECDNRCQCRAIDNVLKHLVSNKRLSEEDGKRVWRDAGFGEWCAGVRID